MPGQVKKALVGVTAFLAVTGLLFSANFLYHTLLVKQPIIDKIGSIAGVDRVELVKSESQQVIKLTISPVADIMIIWPLVVEAATEIAGTPEAFAFEVENQGEPPAQLAKASVSLELALRESLATGTYTIIPQVLADFGHTYGITSETSLSQDLLLIELSDAANKVYKVITLKTSDRG